MTDELTVHNLSVHYGTFEAVRSASFTLHSGEILALLGSSGSGKSTLLRAISGLEPASAGDILWRGESVLSRPVHLRGFGLMFQDGQLFPHRDVRGNVAYGLTRLSPREREERIAEVLDLVGMGEYASRPVTSLSGGQAQRIALARALAPSPRLILLDEPLSALDRALRERLSTDIRDVLKTAGTAGVYVTHDQDEAFAVADRIAVMIDGRIVRIDTPRNLWKDPQRRDVAEFLGYGPFVRDEATGDLRALPPGALSCVEPHSPHSFLARVSGEVRVGRGNTTVNVEVDGQRAQAHVGDGYVLSLASGGEDTGEVQHLAPPVGGYEAEAGGRSLARPADVPEQEGAAARGLRIGELIGVTFDRATCPLVEESAS